nr:putative ribonuclease H-like domain-containing protein [Tanacetum cinerariifolium]
MEPNKALIKDAEVEDVDVHLYRSMICSLMYLTASRPDITFDVCACVRFQVTPKTPYLYAVKIIFRYLKGHPRLDLWYPRDSPFDLEAYSNSDYAGASLDRKSTIGGDALWINLKLKLKDVKLHVDYKVEMAYDLLRLIKSAAGVKGYPVCNKVNAAKSRVTTDVKVSTAGWIKIKMA